MIEIVCVNYHCERHVGELRAALAGQSSAQWHLTVVDNGSDAEGAAVLAGLDADPSVTLVRPATNLGYLGGVQHAVDVGARPYRRAHWTVVCNPDIRFPDPDLVAHLAARDGTRPEVVAPSITLDDGHDQNPYLDGVPPTWLTAVRTVVTSSPMASHAAMAVTARLRARRGPIPSRRSDERPVLAPHGAFVCFSAGYLAAGLDFRHDLFLYGEEVAIAERCVEAAVPVTFVPTLRVSHLRNATTAVSGDRTITRHRRRAAWADRRALGRIRRMTRP